MRQKSAGMTMHYSGSRPLPKKGTYCRNIISKTIYFDSFFKICSVCSNTLLKPQSRSSTLGHWVQFYFIVLCAEHITSAQHDLKKKKGIEIHPLLMSS